MQQRRDDDAIPGDRGQTAKLGRGEIGHGDGERFPSLGGQTQQPAEVGGEDRAFQRRMLRDQRVDRREIDREGGEDAAADRFRGGRGRQDVGEEHQRISAQPYSRSLNRVSSWILPLTDPLQLSSVMKPTADEGETATDGI